MRTKYDIRPTSVRALTLTAFLLAGIALSACGTKYNDDPRGVGREPADLKIGPCAGCQLLPQNWDGWKA